MWHGTHAPTGAGIVSALNEHPAVREGLYLLWLARVERRLIAATGCEVLEFPEFDFRARYAAKVAPADVVAELGGDL
jgi:hypothetical protein